MNRRFRCGLLMLTKDGTLKKIELENGGGPRFCIWNHEDMDFNTIHRRLLDIFELNNHNGRTSLYDFQHRPLDVNAYRNLSQYIDKYGLYTRSTILYLCIEEVNHEPNIISTKINDTIEMKMPTSDQQAPALIETNSPILSLRATRKLKQQLFNKHGLKFGLKRSCINLIKKINSLINENNEDKILIRILANFTIIKDNVWSTIDKIQKKLRKPNEFIRLLNNDDILRKSKKINDTYDIFNATQELLTLNKTKFDHIKMYSIVINIFSDVYENYKKIRCYWFENVENKNNNLNNFSISSSSTHSNFQFKE